LPWNGEAPGERVVLEGRGPVTAGGLVGEPSTSTSVMEQPLLRILDRCIWWMHFTFIAVFQGRHEYSHLVQRAPQLREVGACL